MGCLLSKHRQIDVYSKAELAHSSVVPFEDHSSVHNPIADPATAVDQWLHSRGHSHYTAAICDAFSQAGFPQAEWLLELQQMPPVDLDLFLEMLAKSPESMQAEQVEQFPRHPAEFDSEEAKRSIQQGQSNHETEGRDAARATVDEWSENEGDQELGEHIDVVFSGDGKLGLVFRTGVVPLVVARIQNKGLAANMPEVQPGMALTAVQGSGLMGLSYAEILDRIKIAGRPLSLSFTQSEPVAEPVAEPEPERVAEPEPAFAGFVVEDDPSDDSDDDSSNETATPNTVEVEPPYKLLEAALADPYIATLDEDETTDHSSDQIVFQCPAQSSAGDTVKLPYEGSIVELVIPDGVGPGDRFDFDDAEVLDVRDPSSDEDIGENADDVAWGHMGSRDGGTSSANDDSDDSDDADGDFDHDNDDDSDSDTNDRHTAGHRETITDSEDEDVEYKRLDTLRQEGSETDEDDSVQGDRISFRCPGQAAAGDTVKLPYEGSIVELVIPDGVGPGDRFDFDDAEVLDIYDLDSDDDDKSDDDDDDTAGGADSESDDSSGGGGGADSDSDDSGGGGGDGHGGADSDSENASGGGGGGGADSDSDDSSGGGGDSADSDSDGSDDEDDDDDDDDDDAIGSLSKAADLLSSDQSSDDGSIDGDITPSISNVEVEYPAGCKPGQTMTVEVHGQIVEIEIPDGAVAGDHVTVQVELGQAAQVESPSAAFMRFSSMDLPDHDDSSDTDGEELAEFSVRSLRDPKRAGASASTSSAKARESSTMDSLFTKP